MKKNRSFWKGITGSYVDRLNHLNRIRMIRDTINTETNDGRMRELFMKYPFVRQIHTVNPSIGFRVCVTCHGGYEYTEWGDDAFIELNKIIYKEYLDGKLI